MRRLAIGVLVVFAVVAVSAGVCVAQEEQGEKAKVEAKQKLDRGKPDFRPGPKQGEPGQMDRRQMMGRMMGRPGGGASVAIVYAEGYLYIVRDNTVYKVDAETMIMEAELTFAEDFGGPGFGPGPMGPGGMGMGPMGPGQGPPPGEKPGKGPPPPPVKPPAE